MYLITHKHKGNKMNTETEQAIKVTIISRNVLGYIVRWTDETTSEEKEGCVPYREGNKKISMYLPLGTQRQAKIIRTDGKYNDLQFL